MARPLPFSERLMIAFFVLLMIVGGAAMGWTIGTIPADFWQDILGVQKIASGQATRQFSKKINQDFVFGQSLHDTERVVTWLITGDWGSGVREGCQGWLFLRDELQGYPVDAAMSSMRLRATIVQQLARQLASKQVHLMLVMVPDKSRIESTHLCGLRRPSQFETRLQQWMTMTGLSQTPSGAMLDLTPVLMGQSGERFYRTDSHWNEAGAMRSAQAIAAGVKSRHWTAGLDDGHGHLTADVRGAMTQRPGDLFHLASLDHLPFWLGPKPEVTMQSVWQFTSHQNVVADSGSNSAAVPAAGAADDLFGDADLPKVVLVGTSFSLRSNFAYALQNELGVQLANVAKDGGEFDAAMRAYLSSATFKQTPPQLIVWEIPERMLQAPIRPEEHQWAAALAQ